MSLYYPDWNNTEDRQRYDEIISKKNKNLTAKEREFQITMYHMEEFACGLDGD